MGPGQPRDWTSLMGPGQLRELTPKTLALLPSTEFFMLWMVIDPRSRICFFGGHCSAPEDCLAISSS